MAKLTPKWQYKKNGDKVITGYNIAIRKSDADKLNWNKDTELNIRVDNNKIVIDKS